MGMVPQKSRQNPSFWLRLAQRTQPDLVNSTTHQGPAFRRGYGQAISGLGTTLWRRFQTQLCHHMDFSLARTHQNDESVVVFLLVDVVDGSTPHV